MSTKNSLEDSRRLEMLDKVAWTNRTKSSIYEERYERVHTYTVQSYKLFDEIFIC